jgi:deoxyribodipyrimidine photolyase-related protein
MPHTLRLILGDQLNASHSWFTKVDDNVIYVMMEMRQETDYVMHHAQKVIAFFAAMRQFAVERRNEGHKFHYLKIGDQNNKHSLIANLESLIDQYDIELFEYQLPDEFRLDKQLRMFSEASKITVNATDTEHFLTERSMLESLFEGKKTYLMETFYRKVRTKYGILMEQGEPMGGKWNFDHDNRNNYDGKTPIPSIGMQTYNHSAIWDEIQHAGIKTFGKPVAENFFWPLNREAALQLLEEFVEKALPFFGRYQDAMFTDSPWLFHSRLSFAMNTKMLHPLEVINRAMKQWKQYADKIDLAQIEGFIRQIIGWREYMRGVYWAQMPEYAQKNYFHNSRKLPEWYWTGETKMNCLHHAINQSLAYAYAHHIQRLMITGNFALLAGVDPDEVDKWYLGVYIDAIEWVEITNTRGMSQFADGGLLATKPYASSANYINKMSNYCKKCAYDNSKRYGEKACPFNSFYWDFHIRNRELLGRNPRIGMVYRNIDKMSAEERNKISAQAALYLKNMDRL